MSFHMMSKLAFLQVLIKKRFREVLERTFSSASWRGSFTVEAALSLTIFVFAIVSLMVPIRIVHIKRQVQAVLEAAGEDMCQYAYQAKVEKEGLHASLTSVAGGIYVKNKVMEIEDSDGIEQVSMSGTRILEDGETIDLQVSYKVKVPFSFWKISAVPITTRSCKRAWVGKSGRDEKNGAGSREEMVQMVYVGNTYSKYHLYADCHYLSNDLEAVPYSEVKDRKNVFGQHYQPCDVCKREISADGVVYIMPGGKKYHGNSACSSIQAYVKKVPLDDEVRKLGLCSYCAKRGGEMP